MANLNISDLIDIGKLGNKRVKETGMREFYLRIKPNFQHLIPRLDNVFLIFKDHRVRYGKIDISSESQKSKVESRNVVAISNRQTPIPVSFPDSDLIAELLSEKEVTIALDEEEINQIDDQSEYFDPVGMKVIWEDKEVGAIKDWFFNGAHDVYELQLNDSTHEVSDRHFTLNSSHSKLTEVLIPDVPAFVIETNTEERYIRVIDLDQFF